MHMYHNTPYRKVKGRGGNGRCREHMFWVSGSRHETSETSEERKKSHEGRPNDDDITRSFATYASTGYTDAVAKLEL